GSKRDGDGHGRDVEDDDGAQADADVAAVRDDRRRRAFGLASCLPGCPRTGWPDRLLIILASALCFGLLHRDRIMTEQFSNKDKAGSGRFSEPVAERAKRYPPSVDFAHARRAGATPG